MRRFWFMMLFMASTALVAISAVEQAAGQKKETTKEPNLPAAGEKDDPELKDPGKLRLQLDRGEHANGVNNLFFTDDSKNLITVSGDRTVRITDARTGENRKILYPPGFGPLGSISVLSPNGKTLALGINYAEGEKIISAVCLMSIPDGGIVRVFKGQHMPYVPFSADGKSLVLFDYHWGAVALSTKANIDYEKKYRIYRLDKNEPSLEIPYPPAFPKSIPHLATLSPDGGRLAVHVGNAILGVFDVQTGKRTNPEFKLVKGPRLVWSPDGKKMVAEGKGQIPKTPAGVGWYWGSVVSPDGKLIAAKGSILNARQAGMCICVWRASDSRVVRRFDVKAAFRHGFGSWSADGKSVAWNLENGVSADGKSVVWNLEKGVSERSFHLGDELLRPGLRGKEIHGGTLPVSLINFGNKRVLEQGELSVN